MTDGLKQLAHDRVEREFEEYNTLHETEIEKLLVSFGAEVQRQTVEACARICEQEANSGECKYRSNCHLLDAVEIRRALLSPSQEVRNG